LVYFMAVWYILWPFGIGSLWSFGIYFPFWYIETKKNLATLARKTKLRRFAKKLFWSVSSCDWRETENLKVIKLIQELASWIFWGQRCAPHDSKITLSDGRVTG
jgi:hypothetical protein